MTTMAEEEAEVLSSSSSGRLSMADTVYHEAKQQVIDMAWLVQLMTIETAGILAMSLADFIDDACPSWIGSSKLNKDSDTVTTAADSLSLESTSDEDVNSIFTKQDSSRTNHQENGNGCCMLDTVISIPHDRMSLQKWMSFQESVRPQRSRSAPTRTVASSEDTLPARVEREEEVVVEDVVVDEVGGGEEDVVQEGDEAQEEEEAQEQEDQVLAQEEDLHYEEFKILERDE